MRLSVIIPAKNAAAHLDHLLSALQPQLLPDDECLLVDDASTDETVLIAKSFGVLVLAMEASAGPAAARNLGAAHASGDVFVFLDADVVPHAALMDRIRQQLQASPEVSALFGSYDANPYEKTTISRFRNLLHCYTHQHGNHDASTFWTGCGAIRRAAFEEIGGFDELRFSESAMEDIDLGWRLKRSGGRIRLDPSLQVQHRKAWRLGPMLHTDVMRRAVPWTRLILESGSMPLDLNLKMSQRVSAGSLAGVCLLLLLFPWAPRTAASGTVVLLATVIVLNAPFYRFLASCGGWWFALRSIPLHLLYFLCGVLGYSIAFVQFHLQRPPKSSIGVKA